MSNQQTPDPSTTGQSASSPEKDPKDWVTGDEPATGAQLSYVSTLAQDAGAEVPAELTKADASELIDELQDKSPRVDESA
ncbi:MAG: DUF3072 domain-containing protein [Solirubrobacteraceae bacterium]|nr:DUF3072 domain-containing protein [Solirubrobacteraceae bacterium]